MHAPRPLGSAHSVARPGRLACCGRSLLRKRILCGDRTLLSRARLGQVCAQGVLPRISARPGLYCGSLCCDNEFLCHDRTRPSTHPGSSVAVHAGTAVRVAQS